jgi:hypothetical protein
VSPIEILKAARELLAKPGAWTKGALARTESGAECAYFSADAACFCATGALNRAEDSGFIITDEWLAAEAALREACGGITPPDFNDAQESVEPVLAAFDRAIAKLESST